MASTVKEVHRMKGVKRARATDKVVLGSPLLTTAWQFYDLKAGQQGSRSVGFDQLLSKGDLALKERPCGVRHATRAHTSLYYSIGWRGHRCRLFVEVRRSSLWCSSGGAALTCTIGRQHCVVAANSASTGS